MATVPSQRSPTRLGSPQLQFFCQQILRRLRAGQESDRWTVGLTSLRGGEGVSTLAANLAIAATLNNNDRVLLVDANLPRPVLHHFFQMRSSPGPADVLEPTVSDLSSTRQTSVSRVSLLPASAVPDQPEELSARFDPLPDYIAEASSDFEKLFVDLPPLDSCADCAALLHALDGIVLVLAGRMNRGEAAEARQILAIAEAPLLGVILNKQRQRLPSWLSRLVGDAID